MRHISFKKRQYARAKMLITESDVFYGDAGGGFFKGKSYPFVLHVILFLQFTDKLLAFFIEQNYNGVTGWLDIFVAMVVFMILLNKFTPLEDGSLRRHLLEMARRVGARVEGVYIMDMSRRTTGLNAMFTGIVSTRRIILGDTMLIPCWSIAAWRKYKWSWPMSWGIITPATCTNSIFWRWWWLG